MSELITEENFDQYFKDVRKNRPQPGQVLARFHAVAAFGPGPHKLDIIKLLRQDKAQQAAQVMQRIHLAKTPDCYRVCREMCEDLLVGLSDEQVNQKEYEYHLEALYYTQKECVPKNDPHWETLTVVRFDPETNTFKTNIEL
jgi:hypothetical protein